MRRFKINIGIFLLMLMGIVLTASTLHSHHNLDLHKSNDFANTGHCFTSETTLCPICAHLIKTDVPSLQDSSTVYHNVEGIILRTSNNKSSVSFVVNKGRSPPVFGWSSILI